jgi:hypothetical protein
MYKFVQIQFITVMRNQRSKILIAGLTGIFLLGSFCMFATTKRYIVRLKGNVLYAEYSNKEVVRSKEPEEAGRAGKDKNAPPAVNTEVTPDNTITPPGRNPRFWLNEDLQQCEISIHNGILQLFPGTFLDSMTIVNQLLVDSIRNDFAKTRNPDSSSFLKVCLLDALKDSLTLVKLGRLSTCGDVVIQSGTGELVAHCKDASTTYSIDSVVMDIFSGSHLVATAITDGSGSCAAKSLCEGDYYVIFSKKSYSPFSLMHVKVASIGQSLAEVSLSTEKGYLFRAFGSNAWLIISLTVVILICILTGMAYLLVKFNARRTVRKTFKAKELSY